MEWIREKVVLYTDVLLDIVAADSLLVAFVAPEDANDAHHIAAAHKIEGLNGENLPDRLFVAAADFAVALIFVVAARVRSWDGGRDGGKSDDESLEHFEGWGWLVGFGGKVVSVEVLD